MKRILTIWLIFNLILCLVLVAIVYSQRIRMDHHASKLRRTKTISENQGRQITKRIQQLEQSNQSLPGDLQNLITSNTDEAPSKSDKGKLNVFTQHEQVQRHLSKNPDYQRFQYRSKRRFQQKEYGAFFDRLNFPPAKLERLKKLLIEKSQAMSDATRIAVDQGFDDDSEMVTKALHRAADEVEKDIRQLLGPENFKAYKAVYHQNRARDFASDIDTVFADKNFPAMTSEQTQALIHSVLGLKQHWDTTDPKILTDMASLLSPEQINAIEEHQKADKRDFEIYMRISNQVKAAK